MSNFFDGSLTTYSKLQYLDANALYLYLNKAIDKRSEKTSQINFVIKDKDGNPIDDHKLLELLNRPNRMFNGFQFWGLYQKYYDLAGEAFILKVYGEADLESIKSKSKYPKELHLLRPDLVKIEYDDNGFVINYIHNTGTKQTDYLPTQIIHIRRPDPRNPLGGQSLLEAGVEIIETGKALERYQAEVIKNGGKIEGILSFKAKLTKTQLEEAEERYNEKYATAKQSGKPLILGGEADYKNLGLTPTELSYLESKNVNLNDVCIMTGVPKPLLSTYDEIKFSNADAANRIFLRETVKPNLDNLVINLDSDLLPFDDETISYVDPTPEDKETTLKTIETGWGKGLTLNEVRELLGQKPYLDPEADIPFINFNLTPIGATEPETEAKKKGVIVKSTHPLADESNRRKYAKVYLKKLDSRVNRFKKMLDKYFDDQEKRLLSYVQEVKRFKKKDLIDETFNISLEVKLAKEFSYPFLLEVIREQGGQTLGLLDYEYEYNLTSEIKTSLDQRVNLFAESINETTFKKLKREFAESIEAGETRDKLVDRIKETYGDIEKGRAEVIARTEIQYASQQATFTAYQQAQVEMKIWVWVAGVKGGVRENHQAIDGEEKPLNMAFSNGLMVPGDGSPAETINCQCTI